MRTSGFTLLEMMAAVLVLALLAASVYAPRVLSEVREFKRAQAVTTAEQINRIASAAQQWTLSHNGRWPGHEQQCANLFQLLIPDYLKGWERQLAPPSLWRDGEQKALPISHARWRGQGKIGHYYPSCTDKHLQIELFLSKQERLWAHYIENRLAGTTVDNYPAQNYIRLRSVWPLPAAIPALASLVSQAEPKFTGDMRSNINMGSHALLGASDVILDNGHALGKTISYANNVRPYTYINAPDCAPGLQPQILTSYSRLLHQSGKPINFAATSAHKYTNSRWLLRSYVVDSDGVADQDNLNIRLNVLVRCS